MKESKKVFSKKVINKAAIPSVGQYVWSNYSFYGEPSPVVCYSAPVEKKISAFDIKRPRIPVIKKTQLSTASSCEYRAPKAVALSDISVFSSPSNESVLHASLGIYHGKHILTDDGKTIKALRQKHKISKGKIQKIIGNMRTELPVCIWGEELGVVLPDTQSIDQHAQTFALIIERLYLICQMTLP